MTLPDTFELTLIAVIAWFAITNLEIMFLHVRQGGRLKRGIKIWSEPLQKDMRHFLRRLSYDLVNDSETGSWIRKKNNTVLVRYSHPKKWWERNGAFPYVAYIDLRVKDPRIQYRIPISPLLFVILWFSIAIWVSFQDLGALLFAAFGIMIAHKTHTTQRKRILQFIEETMQTLNV